MGRVWMTTLVYWIVVSTLCCILYPVMVFDPMARYAPMADAFARGDFALAYHPRFGVLFTTLAGCVAYLTGLRGDCACQVVSVFFLAFSAVPVWLIMKRVFRDTRVAWLSVALVLASPEYFILAEDGLRDTVRIFGLACGVLPFLGVGAWTLALGLFCLVTVRTDLFLISGALLFAWWLFVLVSRRRYARLILPTAGWFAGALAVTVMTAHYTGYWLPGAQFVGLYLKLTGGAL